MGEIIYLSRERIHVTLYTHARGWGRQDGRMSDEDAATLSVLKAVVTELGPWYFELKTRSWMTHFYEAILHGGWWSPVVMVDRAVFSQGSVPNHTALRAHLNAQIHILRPRLAKSS